MNTRRVISLLAALASAAAMQLGLAAPDANAAAGAARRDPSGPLPKVEDAWVRSTVAGQQGSGVFMKLSAAQATRLVGASTPVARTAELHEMKMKGDIMRMRQVSSLDLPAGRVVELKPGGYHLMLMGLKQPLAAGSTVPLTLLFRDANGRETSVQVNAAVATQPPGHSSGSLHKH